MGVIFGGEIEEEGEERVGVDGDVRLEAGRAGRVSWCFSSFLERRGIRNERTYAIISARVRGEGKCIGESRSHWPFDNLAR